MSHQEEEEISSTDARKLLAKYGQLQFNMGKVLLMGTGLESYLEFFISNYFVNPQNSKTHFFSDCIISELSFEKKIGAFKLICKREEFDKKIVDEALESIRFVQKIRNKVAHWQAESLFNKQVQLRKRKSTTSNEDTLKLTEEFMHEILVEQLKAIEGIEELHTRFLNEGTIDERGTPRP